MGSLGLTEDWALAVISRVRRHHDVMAHDLARRFMTAAVSSAADTSRDVLQVLVDSASALGSHRSSPPVP